MKTYSAKQLGFTVSDQGDCICVMVTPLDYWEKHHYFYDQHFAIKELPDWHQDSEAVYLLDDYSDTEEVRRKLLELGMRDISNEC